MLLKGWRLGVVAWVVAFALQAGAAVAAAPESARLGRAKDYIADEQWARAIVELRLVVADPKEKSRDEALYWLAHSLNQAGDSAAAISTIRRLERDYPASLWVKPAGSLRLDIAVHLQRSDVLWWMAAPPAPPAPPVPPAAPAPRVPGALPVAPTPPVPAAGPVPPAPSAPPGPPAPASPPVRARAGKPPKPPSPAAAPAIPAPPAPPAAWLPEEYRPDTDIRIQALDRLMSTDAPRVIPILRQIALSENVREASRAVFVLAQSGKPEARKTVAQVAMLASDPVRIAAVKELGRFGGPEISDELMQVYATASSLIKMQVVTSLGERAERKALLKIAEGEKDPSVKATAIVTVGRAGGPEVKEQLRLLYKRVGSDSKRPIIIGLFNAHAEDELIRIADQEKDPQLRSEALMCLRLLGTPKAKEFLQKRDGIR
jgi:HEAT repeat protein